MVPPGRPRKVDPTVPRHIDQTKIPTGIYWDGRKGKGTWYGFDRRPGERPRRKNLAGPTATLADLHVIAEARSGRTSSRTLRGLCEAFHSSEQFRVLATSTQEGYAYSRDAICGFKLASGGLVGDLVTKRITPPVIQGLIDALARGTERDAGGALIATPSKAAHAQRYLRRLFRWGLNRGYNEINPAAGIEMPKERKRRVLPEAETMQALIAFAKARAGGRGKEGSVAPYLWAMIVIGYRCRLRPIEVRTLTDANHTPTGILTNRRKGSRDNVTEWSADLREAWDYLAELRKAIWNNPKRPRPVPLRPEARTLVVNRDGQPLSKDTYNSAWARLQARAVEEGVLAEGQRFGAHSLKRRGITDTPGTRQEKQLASGHVNERMLEVYDFSVPLVKPAGERP